MKLLPYLIFNGTAYAWVLSETFSLHEDIVYFESVAIFRSLMKSPMVVLFFILPAYQIRRVQNGLVLCHI